MINYIVLGKNKYVLVPVLQAMRSFTDAKAIAIGGEETRSLRWSSLCVRQVTIDFDGRDDDAFVAFVNGIVEKIHHVTLVPADCEAIRLVNRVRSRLALQVTPIPATSTLDMFDDKWQFNRFCERNRLATPPTRRYESKAEMDYLALAGEFGLPFVVKPVDQAGSRGVRVIHNRAEFDRLIANNKRYDHAPLIAQRHIEGYDVDVSLLADRGQIGAFAVQQAEGGAVRFMRHGELEQMAEKICRASAFTGVMHIDARVERRTGKVWLLESNPRFWASLPASVACGLNFVAESIHSTQSVSGVRKLAEGMAPVGNPLFRPAAWSALLSDGGEAGRLMRAMAFDLHAIASSLLALPSMLWRGTVLRAGAKLRTTKRFGDLLAGLEQNRLSKH